MASRALRRRASFRAVNGHARVKSHPLLKFFLVGLVAITMVTSGASAATIFFYGQNLPTLKNFKQRFEFQNTIIRDSTGRQLYDMADLQRKGGGKRVVEPIRDPSHRTSYYRARNQSWLAGWDSPGIPVDLQNATIATEDATFYNNLGFDPLSIVRAGIDNYTQGHIVSGGSTITQQLVKEYMLDPSPSLGRKAEEVVLATELTQKYTKQQILFYYLNSVPYGNLSIGAQAAAKTYFHTGVWHLDPLQCAFLAGLPEAPELYNPVNNLPAAKARMVHVLHLEYQHGYLANPQQLPEEQLISQLMNSKEVRGWKFSPPITLKHSPHFVQYAIDQLQALSITNKNLHGRLYDGLDVWTTLDPKLQHAAEHIVKNQIGQLGAYHVTDGALVSEDLRQHIDVHDGLGPTCCYGFIRAMVGSADYHNVAISGQINMADRPRQPGSSFKPFNYILGFENGLAPATTVLDAPLAIPDAGNPADGGWYEPRDYDLSWHGTVTLRTALQNSLNIPAVKVEQFNANQSQKGLLAIRDQAVSMGLTSFNNDNPHCCGYSLTLGGLERGVRLVEETSAYGVFATNGYTAPPIAIWKVFDRNTHKLLYDAYHDGPKSVHVIKQPEYTYLMNNVLSDNASRCQVVCEFGLTSPLYLGRPAGAKTGTTNGYTDNWTVGYTPDIVTGVWVGNADNSPMVGTTGVTGAAPIWHDFMLTALNAYKLPPKPFWQPPGIMSGASCRQPGAYTAYSTMGYDIFAGIVPYCSVGTYNTALPVPQQNTPYQAPVANSDPAAPVAPAIPAAPLPTAPPAAAPQAPVTQQPAPQTPTPQPQPVPQPPAPQQQPAPQQPTPQPQPAPQQPAPQQPVPGVQPGPPPAVSPPP